MCHIFSNQQGTIHLTYPSQTQQQLPDIPTTQQIFEEQRPIIPPPQELNCTDTENYMDSQMPAKKRKLCRINDQANRLSPVTSSPNNSRHTSQSPPTSPPIKELLSTEDDKIRHFQTFEIWLAGVNDRINATMNYQLSTQPDPHVYYISGVSYNASSSQKSIL